jgi:hypothetical protein
VPLKGSNSFKITKLTTCNSSIIYIPTIITNRSPLPFVKYFNTASTIST